ncbi:IS66 family insertion sequence element accessory protein TnpB [Tunicatimonas pelagia]|uniref:IS66 family insertion sequence element accessory protein TnpB n=1 Tax=Tunicatimonas pelagia TaxID=931531 RepID=UPI0026662034|nr:IS66 family insertion sequence element accessory protein TnpB [Tunicatimonas pelagia]WKN44964.1 IS66 family insertion sequence element accessory protein TnpB [Tunicatimonas pelagia]WKN46222.1 IS66 family insertion sequence element accessory protein TnpB [Tunicatimonas pelagia]
MLMSLAKRIFLYSHSVDMRKGFDGLSGIVSQQMGADVLSGDAYVFVGRRKDRLKLLIWESSGFVLYYKRLEAGTFRLPAGKQAAVALSSAELWALLEGLDVEVKQRRKRYKLSA